MKMTSLPVKFTCANDCVSTGCPGHTVRAWFDLSSHTLSFEFDDREKEIFDPDRFKAMKEAAALLGK